MDKKKFLRCLQIILSLIEPNDSASVDLGRVALITLSGLIRKNTRTDEETLKLVENATNMLGPLIEHCKDFSADIDNEREIQAKIVKLNKLLQ